jgi:hypothetical protein
MGPTDFSEVSSLDEVFIEISNARVSAWDFSLKEVS